jgi:hypothetical protein
MLMPLLVSSSLLTAGLLLLTFVTLPCMMRKCGLFTFSCTDWNRSATRLHTAQHNTAQRGSYQLHPGPQRLLDMCPMS